jgi:tRNA U34 2-thiouridine synthase MnmA/TrmU
MKAIALISGGLDSQLAAKLIKEQGVEMTGLHFTSLFQPKEGINGKSIIEIAASQLAIPVRIKDITEELIELVKSPEHGHGSGWNPCIDCRILQLRIAAGLMRADGLSFIVTGEVVGQRPMSQRKDAMKLIEREAGLEGLVVRPLCAGTLDPSIPEEKGWIDREKLCTLTGRQRTPQIKMAKELGITNYLAPAGGCRLTEPGFARRVGDLVEHDEFRTGQIKLLQHGRHFRLNPQSKLVVGRDEGENYAIEKLAEPNDILMKAMHFPGPTSLLRGEVTADTLNMAAGITARYGKGKEENSVEIEYSNHTTGIVLTRPISDESLLEKLRI